jgi:hypothetical protein
MQQRGSNILNCITTTNNKESEIQLQLSVVVCLSVNRLIDQSITTPINESIPT